MDWVVVAYKTRAQKTISQQVALITTESRRLGSSPGKGNGVRLTSHPMLDPADPLDRRN